ncbi:hypothetical protein K0U83_01130 [bacterium]|nr:hypothetical protein [bacterium]
MQVETKDPKVIIGGLFAFIAAVMGGSFMGFTIEPKETTDLRTEAALLAQQVENLEMDVATCLEKNPDMKLHSQVKPPAEKPEEKPAEPAEPAEPAAEEKSAAE